MTSSERIGAVVLAGGGGRRMGGTDKGRLNLGGMRFLDRILRELGGYGEVLLSVDRDGRDGRYPECGARIVVDEIPDRGPLGGLVSALAVCRSDALLAVAADMPLFVRGLGEYLRCFLTDDCDAAVVRDRAGRVHPLCGIYRKRAVDVLRRQLDEGDFRMTAALEKLRVRTAPLAHSAYGEEVVANVNNPEEYAALVRRVEGPPVIAVSGVKNSGKTTLLAGVIPLLRRAGLRVGAVKHDGHDFVPDVPGTDSFRLREAGAEWVGVYSPRRYLLTAEREGVRLEDLLERAGDLDLVLVEGAKDSALPKIEVVRATAGSGPVCDPSTLLALCTDGPHSLPGVPTLRLGDFAGAAAVIMQAMH